MRTEVLDLAEGRIVPEGEESVVTVGTFDGVHRGHWAVLEEIRRRARLTGRRSILVTFHPHPLAIVRPEHAPRLLTTATEKREILSRSGLDYAVFVHFTPELSRYSPERFVDEILLERLGVGELVIGYDHGFGRGRSGDADTLRKIGEERGFSVDVVNPVVRGDSAISSTAIRAAVSEGRLRDAAEGLGRPYSLTGIVVRGEQRGRTLGFPTANLGGFGSEKLLPPSGVYAVRVETRAGRFGGGLHLGPRPTFQGAPPSVEVFLLDFDGDLYGDRVRVDFIERIREVERFESVDALVDQMESDIARAREILEAEPEPDDGWELTFEEGFAWIRIRRMDVVAFEEAFTAFLEDPRTTGETGTLWDLRGVPVGEYPAARIPAFIERMRSLTDDAPVDRAGARVATLVKSGVDFGVARMVDSRARSALPQRLSVFTSESEAIDYLRGVPGE